MHDANPSTIDLAPSLAAQKDAAAKTFAARFGRSPEWIVAAPGRVNLIGEHTDYNDGFVLPMAIDRYAVLAAAPATDSDRSSGWRVYSHLVDEETIIDRDTPGDAPAWSLYLDGVVQEFKALGTRTEPLDVVVQSFVPLGGGLSSSAALEVATASLIETVTGTTLDAMEKVKLCQRAENVHVGVPCGIMDQFSSAMGRADHLMQLDCRSLECRHVPLTDPAVEVLITNTNVKHALDDGEYAKRRAQCHQAAEILKVASLRDTLLADVEAAEEKLGDVCFRRARHVVTEIERTQQAAGALVAQEWRRIGQLMYASHHSLRDDYEVSCQELDVLVDAAEQIGADGGVLGSRMTGGGFGGCTVSLVRKERADQIAAKLHARYLEATGIEPTFYVSRAAAGAQAMLNV